MHNGVKNEILIRGVMIRPEAGASSWSNAQHHQLNKSDTD